MDEDFGVAGGVEEVSEFAEALSPEFCVDEVSVVSDGDLAADVGLEEWLRVAGERAAGGGVTVVPDRSADAGVLFESGECGRVEDVGHEAHACVPEESLRGGDGDSR